MVPFIFIHDILIHGRRHAPLRMIHQLECLARVVLREPTVSFGKSTGGDWVLRLPQQVGPQVDFTGAEEEARRLLHKFQPGHPI